MRKGNFAVTDTASIKTASAATLLQDAVSLTLAEETIEDAVSDVGCASLTSSGGAASVGTGGSAASGGLSGGVAVSAAVGDADSAGDSSAVVSLPSGDSELSLPESSDATEEDTTLPENTETADTTLSDTDADTSSAASTVALLSSSSGTSSAPLARTFSLRLLGSAATTLSETESSTTVYGWSGSAPTRDGAAIAYPTSATTTPKDQAVSLTPSASAYYKLQGALNGLDAGSYDVKFVTDTAIAIRTINITSGAWAAGSVWLSGGTFNVSNLPAGNVEALYVVGARLHIAGGNSAVTISPGTLFIGERSSIKDSASDVYNQASLSASATVSNDISCDVKVVSETKLAVYGGAVLTFSGSFDATDKTVYFVGSAAGNTSNGYNFTGESTFGTLGVSVLSSNYNADYVGGGVVVTFSGGTSTIGTLEMQTRNSSYSNGIVIGGGSGEAVVTITGGITATGGTNGANVITVDRNGRLILSEGTERTFADGVIATTVDGTLRNEGNLTISGTLSGSGVIENTGTLNLSGSDASVGTVKNTGTLNISDAATLTAKGDDRTGIITNATFSYDSSNSRATITGGSTGGRIENTLITVAAAATLELSNMVLADTVKITDDPANFVSNNNVVELGAGNSGAGAEAVLQGVTLNATGSSTAAKADVSGKVYTISFSGIQDVSITGTLTFDFSDYSAEINGQMLSGYDLFRELAKDYDYIAVEFVADSTGERATLQYENLTVKAKVDGVPAISTGYYNGAAASEAVVYFDSIALPEPATGTLTLMALAALCARRRRRS